jgi:hypothetical protein
MSKAKKRNMTPREEVGFNMVEALEKAYEMWQQKKTPAAKKRYLTWRLRLRLKFNHRPELLLRLNEESSIGLFDEEVGPLYDDVGHVDVWSGA